MKFLLSLCLTIATVCGQDWTCDECVEGGTALAQYMTNDGALEYDIVILTAEICPGSPDPASCEENLPRFWKALAKVILPEHCKHICDDLECDNLTEAPVEKSGVPGCEACTVRINGGLGHSRMDYCPSIRQLVLYAELSRWCG